MSQRNYQFEQLSKNLLNNNNNITIHFSGYDSWDFDWNDKAGFWYNVSQEFIPSIVAGKGKSFKITYDFNENITINF